MQFHRTGIEDSSLDSAYPMSASCGSTFQTLKISPITYRQICIFIFIISYMYVYCIHPFRAPITTLMQNNANIFEEIQPYEILHYCPLLWISTHYRDCKTLKITASVRQGPRPCSLRCCTIQTPMSASSILRHCPIDCASGIACRN